VRQDTVAFGAFECDVPWVDVPANNVAQFDVPSGFVTVHTKPAGS